VARTQINIIEINSVFRARKISGMKVFDDIKIVEVIILIAKILVYSAIKIRANGAPPYSILNPETNSDSPSAKSNGVRLVSAKLVINHKRKIGSRISDTQEYISKFMSDRFSEEITINEEIRIRAILTSYEIVCATPRSAPSRAYFEFEAQPAEKVVYTLILEIHRKNKIPNVRK
jgi:hypothetical protein